MKPPCKSVETHESYTIIRSDEQYSAYCKGLENLTSGYQKNPSGELLDLIDTITLLIEKYDEEHTQLSEVDPIRLLKSLMRDNNMNQKDLSELLQLSKGHLSDILNYKKGLSKMLSAFYLKDLKYAKVRLIDPTNYRLRRINITEMPA